MIFLYKFAVYLSLTLVLPVLPFIWLFSKKRRANLFQRFGFNTGITAQAGHQKRLWVHALSVGETVSSVPFIQALKLQKPSVSIIFTASTKTGFDMAQKLFQDPMDSQHVLVDQIGYFPFDIGFSINRVRRRINPDAVVMVETDLWPNFLYEMKQHAVPVVLINARLSERSLKGYQRFAPLASMIFSSLKAILAQSSVDKERFDLLGQSLKVAENTVKVTGNIKFDQPAVHLGKNEIQTLRDRLCLLPGDLVFIGGSTHSGEETLLLDVYQNLKKKIKQLKMIVAPRDPERARDIREVFDKSGICTKQLGQLDKSQEKQHSADVIVVDKMGELSKLYAICDVAFIGGSMVSQGGHNPLEAAAVSKPIVFGPDMSDFISISELLIEQSGAKQVTSETELTNVLELWLQDDKLLARLGDKNFNVFSAHSGAVENIIREMENLGIV